jgi:hypothetical protein
MRRNTSQPARRKAGAVDHLHQLVVRRIDIRLVQHGLLDPRIAAREPRGDLVRDDDGLALARPEKHHRTRRIGEIHVPRERPRIHHAAQIREILAGAQHQRVQARLVHQGSEPRDVGDGLLHFIPA